MLWTKLGRRKPGEPTAGTESWSGRQRGALCVAPLGVFQVFGRLQKLAAGSTPPSPWERPGLNRIWCAAGEVSLRGGWCRSPLHRAPSNLFREKNRLGQRGTRTEAWSGPVFFLARSQGLDAGADRVSSCPGRIPICKWSTVNGEPVLCHVFLFFFEQDCGHVDAERDNLVKSVETRRAALGSHAPTHPRKPPSHTHARAQPSAELIVGAWVPGCLGGLLAAPGHMAWWQQPGKPRILRIAKAIYQESYFPQRGCDNDRRLTARLTSGVENMPVRAENSFASASACCCSSSISSIMIGSWRVHEEQGTSFFSGCQPRGTNSGTGTETGTGKIQEQVWCVHPQWTNHLPLPPPSLIGPRPCPTPPNCFSLFC